MTRTARSPLMLGGLFCLCAAAAAHPGMPDRSFGRGGRLLADFGGNDGANAVAVRRDGKIVIAGASSRESGTDILLARFRADGRPDRAFGDRGRVLTDAGGRVDYAAAMAVADGGKLLVAGAASRGPAGGAPGDFLLARYHPDGRLDRAFGEGGLVTVDFGADDAATSLLRQPDGKIIAGGYSRRADFRAGNFALARCLPDGRLDPAFAIGGRVTTSIGALDHAWALALQPDGKIVAAGDTVEGALPVAPALARYLPSGELDRGFGSGGRVRLSFPGSARFRALALQPSSTPGESRRIVAVGEAVRNGSGEDLDFLAARFRADGRLDGSFGDQGVVLTDFGGADVGTSVLLQPGGRIVLAGAAAGSAGAGFGLARYTRDGRPDRSFGRRGLILTPFSDDPAGGCGARALALGRDGKLVAAGAARSGTGKDAHADVALARYRR